MEKQQHSMDLVFALILFACFAVCSMLLVLLGAKIYSKEAQKLNTVDTPVILSYLTEKLRRSGGASAVFVGEDGSLQIREKRETGDYVTWIYVEDGSLKETLTEPDAAPIANIGNVIGEVEQFEVRREADRRIEIEVTDGQGQAGSRTYWLPV